MVDNILYILDMKFSCDTYREYYEGYLDHLAKNGSAEQTLRRYKTTFNQFAEWLNGRYVCRATYVDWFTEMEADSSLSTLQSRHGQMNGFFDYLVKQGFLRANPLQGLEVQNPENQLSVDYTHLDSPMPLKYYYAAMQKYALLGDESSLRDWVILEIMYGMGLTPTRIPNIEVNLSRGVYKLDPTKGFELLTLIGPDHAMESMAKLMTGEKKIFKGEWVSKPDMSSVAARAIRSAKEFGKLETSLSPRDFVVSFCGRALSRGEPIEKLKSYTGHSFAWCEAISKEYAAVTARLLAEEDEE